MKFSVEEAKKYSQKGKIAVWVHEFLTSSGRNEGLAKGLRNKKRFWIGPKKIKLEKLERCCGPEKKMEFREPEERWEKRVQNQLSAIKRGWKLPPLIVEYRKGKLSIRDGNHRIEALQRARFKKYEVIIWYNNLKDLIKHNKMKFATFFITGTSSAGKSTLVRYIKSHIPFARVHDFDEGGVPPNPDEAWRKRRTNHWLQEAQNFKQDGKVMVICGVCVPKEIKSSKFSDSSLNLHFGYIHIGEDEIRKRLTRRGWPAEEIKANIKWAKHLERFVKAEKNHFIVDGETNNPTQVAEEFAGWIVRAIT